MRLVDIDKSIESVKNLIRNGATIEQALDAQPTAYDPEEVVEQLEDYRSDFMYDVYEIFRDEPDNIKANHIIDMYDEIFEIVKGGE